MTEIWKPVKGYEGIYEVSNTGRIKRLCREYKYTKKQTTTEYKMTIKEKILNPVELGSSKQKYLAVNLRDSKGNRKMLKVHRLVANSFIPNPENLPQIDHKDGNKHNNNVNNLEWVTGEENYRRALQMGLACSKGERNGNAKLTAEQVAEIRKVCIRRDRELSACALSKKYGVCRATIERIVNGKAWS